MHVPVDRQTCHVIPDTNQKSRNILIIISQITNDKSTFVSARARSIARMIVSLRETLWRFV